MKKSSIIKSLSILTLSLVILIPSTIQTIPALATNQIILHVNSSNFDPHTSLYIAESLDENGDIWVIQSYDNISNQWLDATINSDYEITDYKIMD